MILGLLELATLAVIDAADTEGAYAARIWKRVEKARGRGIPDGQIHAVLSQLRVKRLVKTRWSAPGATQGARRRRLYELTKKGAKALQSARQSIGEE